MFVPIPVFLNRASLKWFESKIDGKITDSVSRVNFNYSRVYANMVTIKKNIMIVSLFSGLYLASLPTHAIWFWLDKSAVSFFNDEDWTLLKSAARNLLDNGNEGEVSEWNNPSSGNYGKIKIVNITDSEGKLCRKTAFQNVAGDHGITGRQVHRLCKQSDGSWKLEE